MSGSVLRWMGVGRRKPLRRMAFSTGSLRPSVSAAESNMGQAGHAALGAVPGSSARPAARAPQAAHSPSTRLMDKSQIVVTIEQQPNRATAVGRVLGRPHGAGSRRQWRQLALAAAVAAADSPKLPGLTFFCSFFRLPVSFLFWSSSQPNSTVSMGATDGKPPLAGASNSLSSSFDICAERYKSVLSLRKPLPLQTSTAGVKASRMRAAMGLQRLQ